MTNFSYLGSMQLTKETTAKYPIHLISVGGKTPSLILRPAGQANADYFNSLLKVSAKAAKAVAAGSVTLEMINETRDNDMDFFPRFVVVGWEDVYDAEGNEVKFSKATCGEFLKALPDHVFDEIRNFAGNMANFVDGVDIDVTAKNSQSG